MNKKYIHPTLRVSEVQTEGLIALSKQEGYASGDDALVKENPVSTPSSPSSYNVWNDDWSK